MPLDYYFGMMEDMVFGPITSVLSGALLILISYRFLLKINTATFVLVIFSYLMITKFDVLFFPPWGDHISGSLSEGIWLLDHKFNYQLLANQDSSVIGGPKYFLFSIFPTYIALLLKFSPTTEIFLIAAHSLAFLMSACCAGIFRLILLKIFDHKIALLSALILISLPLYQSMTEMINMEIPTLLCSLTALLFLSEKKFLPATLMAIIAVSIKGSGAIACGTVFAISLFVCIFESSDNISIKGRIKVFIFGGNKL